MEAIKMRFQEQLHCYFPKESKQEMVEGHHPCSKGETMVDERLLSCIDFFAFFNGAWHKVQIVNNLQGSVVDHVSYVSTKVLHFLYCANAVILPLQSAPDSQKCQVVRRHHLDCLS